MLVDYERLLLDLKAIIAGKNSHGQRDLLSAIARLEAEHAIPPDEFERFVRTFGHHLQDSFMGLVPHVEDDDPPARTAASARAVVGDPHLRRPTTDSEESCQTTQQRTQEPEPPPPSSSSRRQDGPHEHPARVTRAPVAA